MRAALAIVLCAACAAPAASREDAAIVASGFELAMVWRVVLTSKAPPATETALRRALVEWRESAPCPMMFTLERGEVRSFEVQDGSVARLPEAFTIEVDVGPTPDGDDGFAHWDRAPGDRGAWVLLRADLEGVALDHAARHELGHGFRLEHENGAPGVMAQTGGPVSAHVTATDARQYADLWCPTREVTK